MRWVNIKKGIKQRLGEILGYSSDNPTGTSSSPTYWSIQAAMLENLRRIVKSIIGNSTTGRPMKGCWMTRVAGTGTINISNGFAFTKDGNIVSFKGVSGYDLSSYGSAQVWVYLKYENTEIPSTTPFSNIGKSTGLIGKSGSYNIVNDNSGVIDDSTVINDSTVIEVSSGGPDSSENYVLLGTVQMASGLIDADTDVVNSKNRGLAPNSENDEFLVPNLRVGDTTVGEADFYNIVVNGTSAFTGAATFSGTATFNGVATFATGITHVMLGTLNATGGILDLSSTPGSVKVAGVSAANFGPAAPASITVVNGIVTAISA